MANAVASPNIKAIRTKAVVPNARRMLNAVAIELVCAANASIHVRAPAARALYARSSITSRFAHVQLATRAIHS